QQRQVPSAAASRGGAAENRAPRPQTDRQPDDRGLSFRRTPTMDALRRGSGLLTCLLLSSVISAGIVDAPPAARAAATGVVQPEPLAAATSSAIPRGPSALQRIDAALALREIDMTEADRQRFFYLFDRRRMEPRWRGAADPPAKCGTRLLAGLVADREHLDPEIGSLLEARLSGIEGNGTASYVTAHFRIDYATSHPDAPVPTDVAPQNGIPDFVESTAAACEQAWAV